MIKVERFHADSRDVNGPLPGAADLDGWDYFQELAALSLFELEARGNRSRDSGGGLAGTAGLVAAGAALIVGSTSMAAQANVPAPSLASLLSPTPSLVRTVAEGSVTHFGSLAEGAMPVAMVGFPPQVVQRVVEATVQVNGFGKDLVDGKPVMVPTLGSGFIIQAGKEYFVVTNAHVVVGRDLVDVTLSDNRSVSVELVGVDTPSDIAVLRLKGKGSYPVATMGDSGRMLLGEPVYAVGSPKGLQNSVTAGIISAVNRSVAPLGGSNIFGMFQTDAAINPGNSGGPLFNEKGEVIGINTSHLEDDDNIAFSIPISPAKRVINEIVARGFATHSYVGAHVTSLSHFELARAAVNREELKLPEWAATMRPQPGALVVGVDRNTPAERAGLKAGDIITSINGTPVREDSALRSAITEQKPGTTLTVGIVRGDKPLTITVSTELRPRSANGQPYLAIVPPSRG